MYHLQGDVAKNKMMDARMCCAILDPFERDRCTNRLQYCVQPTRTTGKSEKLPHRRDAPLVVVGLFSKVVSSAYDIHLIVIISVIIIMIMR